MGKLLQFPEKPQPSKTSEWREGYELGRKHERELAKVTAIGAGFVVVQLALFCGLFFDIDACGYGLVVLMVAFIAWVRWPRSA